MANWCSNRVEFLGEESQLMQLATLFQAMAKKEKKTERGQLPQFVNENDGGYFFESAWENGILYYQTKWAPNTEVLVKIAEEFKVGFNSSYDESGCGVYGEAAYQNRTLLEINLDSDDIAQYEYDEENETYRFENQNYECSEDILEILLQRKKSAIKSFKPVSYKLITNQQSLIINIMAHNLNYNEQNNDYAFFSVKEKAWHNLGKVVDQYPTSAEAIKFAGLDYVVEKRPLFTFDTENHYSRTDTVIPEIIVPNYYATVRTDTEDVLGVVGKDYEIVQNINAFEFFDAIVGGGDGILYETAGALGKGERIFITAKLPDYIRVGKDDLIEQYLFLTTSHNGFGSITAAFTPIRVVCNNTLNAALNNHSNAIKIRHTSSANERIKQAHTLMGISNNLSAELDSLFNHWSQVRITDYQVKKLVQIAMAPNKEVLQKLYSGETDELSANYTNLVDKVYDYAFASPTQQMETTAGTVFGAYNAITGYFQNVRNYKDDEAKFRSVIEGTAKTRGQTAFDLCREFAIHGADVLKLN